MKVPLEKLAKLIGESVEAIETLQGSVLPDGVEVDLATCLLAYCNWLRAGGKAKQSLEIQIREEQLRKLTADRKFSESRVSGSGATLSECATLLGIKTDTLKKWHGYGCPGEKVGNVWNFDTPKVFAWKLARTVEECTPKSNQDEISSDSHSKINPEYERARKDKEMADKVALQNARSRGELVEIAAVKKLGEKVFIAVRNRILNMPLTDEEKDFCLRELLALGDMDWNR